MENSKRPQIGVSACLMGEQVRFDGGHKKSSLLTDRLRDVFDFQAFCPEVAIGMGIPRRPIRLIERDGQVRAVGSKDAELDVTDKLASYAVSLEDKISRLDGYVFMQKSPSCGVFRVKLYNESSDAVIGARAGIFAEKVMQAHPNMPIEEAGRLNEPALLENFVVRVCCYREWKDQVLASPSPEKLQLFHRRYKYLLMAHHPQDQILLGNIAAQVRSASMEGALKQYETVLMRCLTHRAQRKNHFHVLTNISKVLRKTMNGWQKQEWDTVLTDYRHGVIPLVAPLTLLKHYCSATQDGFLAEQVYLQPYPSHLGLRNAI
ncbi:DUF523 and DUF1722 domain-containing protein [Hahella sp. CR1]|uniref:DUF523 and DUF1722 domain-containing protein n=1 Tax=Hahella sp. CR1 TaxID=2992807 RepID=UPI0024425F1E|nr:DUF523 and DUF1722 domain-containing protein [Hahella sp. CR1]MDG9667830.1 DUF523 and DUF1722 domain-containing protein [Hahella sp. CR1]